MKVLITGASQGIGAAIARRFATEAQADLTLVARGASKLAAVETTCKELGARARSLPCDLTDPEAVQALANNVLDDGPPGILINNAGRFEPGKLLETDAKQFRSQLDVNLTSAFLVTRTLLPAMIESGSGDLVFLASVASLRAYPGGAAYCAAKHGLLGLARAAREETRETGVRVLTMIPGATLTPSWDGLDIPPERFMPAEDVAQAIFEMTRLSRRTVVEELLLRPLQGDL